MPIGLHLLGAVGVWKGMRNRKQDPFLLLCLGTILFWLLIFSSNVPVYDGERLFSPAFPLWAIVIGAGFGAVWEKAKSSRFRRGVRIVFLLFLAIQAQGVVWMHPFGLSYYNAFVGGLAGAQRLGLEPTYWGDAVDRRLLESLERDWKPGEMVAMSPTLAPGQGLASTPTSLLRRGIVLLDEEAAETADWVVLWRRSTYWKPAVVARVRDMKLVAETRRQGVWLARLYRGSKKRAGVN